MSFEQDKQSSNDSADQVDLSDMSPQSRKRYQSRISSARLRERQRQRISQAESDITKLEKHVQTLEELVVRRGAPVHVALPQQHDFDNEVAISQSLGRAIDSLESSVGRIETLRCRIGRRVEELERLADDTQSSRHSIAFLMCDHEPEKEMD
ncbi:hypothetical protein LPJ59_005845 [Coemansia sp. RSA 2399]|nr:hypothetical protein LPJ59_005845 [Coemansia sp. RSA 2399]KAJ1891577.1 hypothetical protein LPJ81_005720 [Coemansia sp. IMI 209127]